MTTTRDPIDEAALILVRALLADLEAGRVFVTKLAGGDKSEGALALEWAYAAAPAEGAQDAPQGPPAPAPAPLATRGINCPECRSGRVYVDDVSGNVCEECCHEWRSDLVR